MACWPARNGGMPVLVVEDDLTLAGIEATERPLV